MDRYVMGAAEARENFSVFLDNAESRPSFINRRRSTFIVMPDSFFELLVPKKIKIIIEHDEEAEKNTDKYDGAYFAYGDVFDDIIGWGNTKEEAVASFKDNLIEFCTAFYENFSVYAAAPNRKAQIPYVIKIVNHIGRGGELSDIISSR